MQKICVEEHQERVMSWDRNQVWWTEEVAKAIGDGEVWKRIEMLKRTTGCRVLLHLYR